MKSIFSTLILILSITLLKAEEPNVLGTWLVGDKDYKVELYKSGNEIQGKVVWLKVPNDKNGKPRTDVDNPDPAKRNQPVLGLKILWSFVYNPQTGFYEGGKVYKEGKTYCGKMKLNTDGTLFLNGYLCAAKFLGKKDTWTRVK